MAPSNFRICALPAEPFAPLFALDADALARRRIRRITVAGPGHLCRVSLAHVPIGHDLLLLPWEHHGVDSPYHGKGPIFVGAGARRAQLHPGEVPAAVRGNLYSVRAYDAGGDIIDAEIAQGQALEPALMRMLAVRGAVRADVHHARYGCYACRAEPVR